MHIPVILFSYRKLRLLYEKALRAKDAQLRARNKSCAAKVIDRRVCEAHFCSIGENMRIEQFRKRNGYRDRC